MKLIHRSGQEYDGEFVIWDSDPDNPYSNRIRLGLRFNGQELIANNDDYFHAMQQIRLQLEKDDLYLSCYGASKNVYPSPMSIDIGAGHRAYRLEIGKIAKMSSLVSIYSSGDDVILSTVAEQEQYYLDWQTTPQSF